jgi:hypothetical protein
MYVISGHFKIKCHKKFNLNRYCKSKIINDKYNKIYRYCRTAVKSFSKRVVGDVSCLTHLRFQLLQKQLLCLNVYGTADVSTVFVTGQVSSASPSVTSSRSIRSRGLTRKWKRLLNSIHWCRYKAQHGWTTPPGYFSPLTVALIATLDFHLNSSHAFCPQKSYRTGMSLTGAF